MNGKSFNAKYQGKILIALYPREDNQMKETYFCLLENLSLWLDYGSLPVFCGQLVTIPNDGTIWIEKDQLIV